MRNQTAAEVLALAFCELFPSAQRLSAHVTGIGFAYDFQLDQPIDQNIFLLIEEKMREVSKRGLPIEVVEMIPQNAKNLFLHQRQSLLASHVGQEEATIIPLVRIGKFYDLYVPGIGAHTGECGYIHLTHFEKNEEFTRVFGFAQPDKKAMAGFLKQQEKAKKNDHIALGEALKLFRLTPDETVWLPKGVLLRRNLIRWWEETYVNKNFSFTFTPPNGATPAETHEILHAKNAGKTFCELSTQSGAESPYPFFRGLLTSPGQTSDLSSLFCPVEQLAQELTSSLQFIEKTLNIFGFEPHWYLITAGRRKTDHKALLQKALGACSFEFRVEEQEIESPKIEARIKDAFGQEWPGPWVEADRKKGLIRGSLLGSLERWIALIIENCEGPLPMWLAPEPVRIIVVGERHMSFAKRIVDRLNCSASINSSEDNMGQKVKAALQERIPCIVVIGDKEEKTNSVTIREDGSETNMSVESFIEEIAKKIKVTS